MSNQKDVFNGAKQFANSQLSLKGGARLYLDGLGLKANAKTAVQAKKQVTDAMAEKAVKANTEKGIYSSYSDSKPSKLELALIGGNYVDVSDKADVEPTLTMTVKDCLAMATPVYANLDKEKAKVNIYGKAGVSLKAFVKPIREAGQGFKRQVISRLTSEVVKCHMKAPHLVLRGKLLLLVALLPLRLDLLEVHLGPVLRLLRLHEYEIQIKI